MKSQVVSVLAKHTPLSIEEIQSLIEIPPSPEIGDYAFPCFILAKHLKKNPVQIALELSKKISQKNFEKIVANGPYLNFFVDKSSLAEAVLKEIFKKKEKYGSSNVGKSKKIVVEFSSPNIAKPFGIGHLRSTIIGSAIANIYEFSGYKTLKINYLGDWGTPFGKVIAGFKKFGSEKALKKNPVRHLYECYVLANEQNLEEEAREWFKKMEDGDKMALSLWKRFRELCTDEFNNLYSLLNVKFDVFSGESVYANKMDSTINLLDEKKLLEKSDGAQIVNLEKYNLGVALIKKSDGATLYATRDLTAAIDRHKNYKFEKMIYEVGSEQNLYFKQLFKMLELLGFSWAKNLSHANHGLYLDDDGKKFSTRKGKTVFMEDIFDDAKKLAKTELKKRSQLSEKELEKRAQAIAISAIVYGDLKNYRENDIVFDVERFLSFEGNTGPYLLYSYARAKSILRKSKYKKSRFEIPSLNASEKKLVVQLQKFPEVVEKARNDLAPNHIANYAYELAQIFNEFYHSEKVLGAEDESQKIALVESFSIVLKNALHLLGIKVLEEM